MLEASLATTFLTLRLVETRRVWLFFLDLLFALGDFDLVCVFLRCVFFFILKSFFLSVDLAIDKVVAGLDLFMLGFCPWSLGHDDLESFISVKRVLLRKDDDFLQVLIVILGLLF